MKSILDPKTREEICKRINALNENSRPKWGKMNVHQMLQHCILCEEMYLGKTYHKRTFIGRLFGRIALRNLLKDETPMQKNAPTAKAFKVGVPIGDVESEKSEWIALIKGYATYSTDHFIHWFFGKMTREQVGHLVYKHTDHHLRQFGV